MAHSQKTALNQKAGINSAAEYWTEPDGTKREAGTETKMLRQAQRLIIALTHAAQNRKLAQNKNVEMSSSAENDKKLMGTELTLALHQNA